MIKRSERTKRKHATHIQGLELFGVDLKKAAKMMASKFATGASVSKTPTGEDEIVVQGDVGDEVVRHTRASCQKFPLSRIQVEMLRNQVKELKGAPADQVTRVRHTLWSFLKTCELIRS